ncbi:SDR family NAD(P)-dependent oxidoreductase [Peribacillus phoenicis]|uniref:SDR family NAD(P)-dependent oxidoreductase n=1 Tax=unclassified Peribacillus TaxID=2675266 RepID=UPI0039A3A3DF
MNTRQLIFQLKEKGCGLFVNGENLTIHGEITAEEEQWLEDFSKEIVTELTNQGEEFWLSEFAELTLRCDFPILIGEGKGESSVSAYSLDFSDNELKNLCKLAKKVDRNYSTLILTAWIVLLHRYTSQEKIPVVTNIFSKHRPEGSPETPIYAEVNEDTSFLNVIEKIDHFEEHYEEMYFPGIQWLEDHMKDEYASKFNISFLYLEAGKDNNYFPEFLEQPFDLSLRVNQNSEGLKLEFLSNSNCFDKKALENMGSHLKNIFHNIVQDKEMIVGTCSMVSNKEKKTLELYHGEKRDYLFEKDLATLFEEQVKKKPSQIALITEEEKVDYITLNRMSNYIGQRLIEWGVTKGTPVGVYVDRSIHTYIALLGILKVGGIYVPLDASYPSDYISQITTDLKLEHFISKRSLSVNLPNQNVKVILADDFKLETLSQYDKNLGIKVDSQDPAVIMYTSGSTGVPKGVKHKQIQLINRFNWTWEHYPFENGDLMCQRTALNFMPSMWELLGGLLQGIPTIIIPDKVIADPNKLLEFINQYQITFMMAVPSLLKMMFQSSLDAKRYLSSIRLCITAGEPLTLDTFNQFQDIFSNAILLNDLGSTETNGVLYFDSKEKQNESKLPNFKTVANTEIYLLDKYLNQVPVGVIGDIYISGAPLALEYVNKPDLNSQSFRTIPQISTEKILYRLGDRARFLSDGTIQLFGRIDHQVKIRGKRVEVGHIESVINKHTDVKESVIVAKKTKNNSNQLYAYVVGKRKVNEGYLKEYLNKMLPDYMVPFRIEIIDSIPKRPNGKIDLKELIDRKDFLTSPKINLDMILESLKKIVSEILEVEPDSVDFTKKFYAVGFDSVSIVEFSHQITKKINAKIEVTELYDCNNLVELAQLIMQKVQYSLLPNKDSETLSPLYEEVQERVIKKESDEKLVIESQVENDRLIGHHQSISQDKNTLTVIINCAASILEVDIQSININKKLYEVGFDSVSIVSFATLLSEMLNAEITTTDLFNCPTLQDVIRLVDQETPTNLLEVQERNIKEENKKNRDVINNTKYKKVLSVLKKNAAEILQVETIELDGEQTFEDLEFTSVDFAKYIKVLNENYKCSITLAHFIEYGSLDALATYIAGMQTNETDLFQELNKDTLTFSKSEEEDKISYFCDKEGKVKLNQKDIAIIGFSGRFPGATDINMYWSNISEGISSILEVPAQRWKVEEYYDSNPQIPNKSYSKWGGFIPDVDKFDAPFFNISKHEAKLMDPQQRLCLEEAYRSLEHAGYSNRSLYSRNVGTYVGIRNGDYTTRLLRSGINNSSFTLMGNDSAILSARLAYLLNLKGPTLAIDTACSSSLVAIHLACQSILNGEIEMAIAGGAHVISTSDLHVTSSKMGMLSPNGQCKTFDNEADGFVPGEAVGFIVVKELQKAIQDGDFIHAVIKGSGINQDGTTNGITAPSVDSQTDLIETTLRKYEINPETITMVEAHGTGTKLGDPIEVKALTNAFRKSTKSVQYSAIGSVKTNIGHAVAGAGIASLTKVLLSLKHKKIPKTLNYTTKNAHIAFEESPFYVNTNTKEWKTDGCPRRASISSFGFSGTNCYMIVEEAPQLKNRDKYLDPFYLVTLSAENETSLKQKVEDLYQWTRKEGHLYEMGDISYTLLRGRSFHAHRLSFIVSSQYGLANVLLRILDGNYQDVNYGVLNQTNYGSFKDKEHSVSFFENVKNNLYSSSEDFRQYLSELAEQFVQENDLEWDSLFVNREWRTVPLPVYPFLQESFWIEEPVQEKSGCKEASNKEIGKSSLVTTINKNDVWVEEHQISNKKIVPAAMYIELVRKSINEFYKQETFKVENFVWMKPIEVKDKVEIEVELLERDQLSTSFNIKVDDDIHATGSFYIGAVDRPYKTIPNVLSQSILTVDKASCYSKFNSRGIKYGDSFRLIDSLLISEEYVLGSLDTSLSDPDATCLIDAVFQTAVGFSFDKNDPHPYMPFTIEEIKIYEDFQSGLRVLVSKDSSNEKMGMRKYHLSLLNAENLVVMEIKGLTQREYKSETQPSSQQPVMLYKPNWKVSDLNSTQLISGTTLLIDVDSTLSEYQIKSFSHYSSFNRLILVKPGIAYRQINRNEFTLDITNKEDFRRFLMDTDLEKIENVVYLSKATVHSEYNPLSVLNLFKGVQGLLEVGYQKEINFIYTYINTSSLSQPQHEAVSGFLRVLEKEFSGFSGKIVEIQHEVNQETEYGLLGILHQEISENNSFHEVSYKKNNRLVKQYEQVNLERYTSPLNSVLMKNGVYIIAGGIGGLGQIFAEYLAKTLQAKIVLTGRRSYGNEVELVIKQIQLCGGEALYFQCDISNRLHVENLIQFTKGNFKKINGIIQSAGIIADSLFRNKSINEVDQVFKPKINGTLYLDELTKDEDMQCFVLFSSISPIMGNIGQSDYAYANSFVDAFAQKREALRKQGKRFGKTLSINWPFWTEGGMKIDESKRYAIQKELGLYDLEKEEGLKAFEIAMNLEYPQLAVIKGERGKVHQLFKNKDVQKSIVNIQVDQKSVTEFVEEDLIILAQQILSNNEVIDVKKDLTEYGLNSISITEFSGLVGNFYDIQIPPSVFFEYSTLSAISEYLFEQYYQVMESHYDNKINRNDSLIEVAASNENELDSVSHSEKLSNNILEIENETDIAIVGLSAKFPGANSVEEFWGNLMAGKSSISMVPPERWYWQKYHGDLNQNGKSSVNMGGFISNIDKFDPAFFGISPAEAKLMDPQQRILLQQVWKALENSGHKPSLLSGEEVGVFIGSFTNDYNNLLIKEGINEGHSVAGNDHSILANRISYTFNFKGPSEAIDTACSSSLVGLHRAVQSLKLGECKLAIVGGVNALLSPDGFIRATKAGMLTKNGQIRSFDQQADGYLRGEGCGVIVLKPLRAALKDTDNIYAVIKGSAINHSGKGYGLTTPSINGQAEVVIKALKDANISPESLSYIEAHGTASKLGDSIEIDAFKKAFKQLSDTSNNLHYCGIGSIKPNIGHLEAASGIASLMKAILALKHKQVPPTINFENLNENIHLEDSPFYIVNQPQELRPIDKSVGDEDLTIKVGVHSFGFGGTNAHIILEEHITNAKSYPLNKMKHLIPFSAKTKKSLLTYLSSFRNWLKDNRDVSIEEIAHSLQTGREDMAERIILIVTNIEDLINQCDDYIDGKEHYCIEGNANEHKTDLTWILDKDIIEAVTFKAIMEEDFTKIAKLWAAGFSIQWERLYELGTVKRISLPTYEFDSQSLWFKEFTTLSEPEENSQVHVGAFKDLNLYDSKQSLDFSNYNSLVTDQIKQLIGIESIDLNVKLFDYGFDSIMAIKLKYLLEEELSLDIPLEVLGKSTTIEAIHSYLEGKIDLSSMVLNLPSKQEEGSPNSQDDLTNADEETLIALFERMTTK